MIRQSIAIFSLVGFAAGCGGGADTGDVFQNLDVRIDMAGNSGNDVDSHDTKMCVNDLGEVYVVWIDKRDGTDDVWFNRSINLGDDWMPAAVKLNRGVQSNVWNPDIGCNDSGVYVVWEDDRDGELQNHNIYFNRSMDQGSSWLENDVLLELDDEGRSFSQGPVITTAGKKDIYVAWYDGLNGAPDVMLAASDNNGKDWAEPVRVDSDDPPGAAFSGSPQIAATASGKVYVVWEDTRNGNSDIYFARSENGGSSFRPDTRLDGGDEAGSNFSFSPQLSADGDNIYVVWHDARNAAEGDGGGGRDVYLNYSGDGGSNWYNTAVRVDSDNAGFFNSLFPQVRTIDRTGYVVWYDNRPNGEIYDIWLRTFEAGEPTGEEVRLSQPSLDNNGQGNSTDVVMASNGVQIVAAWEDERDGALNDAESGYNDLYYNFVQNGVPQADDLRLDTFYPANSFKTDLNVALTGQLVFAAWTDGREGTGDVFFKKLTLGEAGETLEGEQTSGAAAQ